MRQQKIAQRLIAAIQQEARRFYYKEIFLLTFDSTLHQYYERLSWKIVGHDHLFGNPVMVIRFDLQSS